MKKVFLLLFLASCSPSNLEELRYEGEAEIRKCTADLRTIETKEDVQRSVKKLRNHFNRIADLVVLGEEKGLFKKGLESEETETFLHGDELFAELARVYEIPGARAIVESAQEEAARKLTKIKRP